MEVGVDPQLAAVAEVLGVMVFLVVLNFEVHLQDVNLSSIWFLHFHFCHGAWWEVNTKH